MLLFVTVVLTTERKRAREKTEKMKSAHGMHNKCVCLRGGNEIFLSQCYTSICMCACVVHVSGFLPFNSLTICAQLPNEHDIMSVLVCVNCMLFSLTVCVDVGFMRTNSYALYANNKTL